MSLSQENQKNYNLPISPQFANIPRGKSLFLTGRSGNGKTTLALQLTKELVKSTKENPIDWSFVSFLDLVKIAQNSHKEGDEGWQNRQKLKYLKETFLLILDDIGVEKQTEFVDQLIYEVIDYRYQHHLPVFITSNFSLEEIGKKYHSRIASRIIGMCEEIKLPDVDRRENEAKNTSFVLPRPEIDKELETKTKRKYSPKEIFDFILAGIKKTNPNLATRILAGGEPFWSNYLNKINGK